MAVQVSPVYISNFRAKKAPREKWRLHREHTADIQDVARGVEESDVGICCRYLVDQLASMGSPDIDEDGYIHSLNSIESFCEKYDIWHEDQIVDHWRKRIRRCRRAINRMQTRGASNAAAVLFIVYGYPDPSVRDLPKKALDSLGEMAGLARYTDRVEVQRKELARLEALRLSACAERDPVPDPETWIDAALQGEAREAEQRSRAIRQGYRRAEYGPHLVDLMRNRDRYEWALRVTSSGDALRALFAPIPGREVGESQEHFEVRKENAETKRDILISEIKVETTEMLRSASNLYKEAWLASA